MELDRLKGKPGRDTGHASEKEGENPVKKFGSRTLGEKLLKTVATTVAVTGLLIGTGKAASGCGSVVQDRDEGDTTEDISEPDEGREVDSPDAEISDVLDDRGEAETEEVADFEEAESDAFEETEDSEPDTEADADPDAAEVEPDVPLDSETGDSMSDGEVPVVCEGEHPPIDSTVDLNVNEWQVFSGYGVRFTEATYTSANMELGCGPGTLLLDSNPSASLGVEWRIDRPAPEPDVIVAPMVNRGYLVTRVRIE